VGTDSLGAFNPEPFSKALAISLDSLQILQAKVERTMEGVIDNCKDAQEAHQDNLQQLSEMFEENFKQFHYLDKRIAKVGNMAVRIGERLEAVDNQRERAIESKQLIEIFLDLNSDQCPPWTDANALLEYFFLHEMDMDHYRIQAGEVKVKVPEFEEPDVQILYEVST
jgi:hypothetical protein